MKQRNRLMKNVITTFFILNIFSAPVLASQWETFFEYKDLNGSAKVEIDMQSIKVSYNKGNKLVKFWARTEMKGDNETASGLVLYESNCTNFESYKLDTTFKFYKRNKLQTSLKSKDKEAVTGKDHEDLIPIVQKLCK